MLYITFARALTCLALTVAISNGASVDNCPGYKASNVQQADGKITAYLTLAGDACNAYGDDLTNLRLLVEYQTKQRLHVKIYDAKERVYQIPEEVVPLAQSDELTDDCGMTFDMVQDPFSFTVSRTSSGEVLFDTSGSQLIFESQYLRLRTQLPDDPNIYGIGESANSLRLNTSDYHQTLWSNGEPFLPQDANLYGAHNIYYDHRAANGTNAVYFHNSNGMKVILDRSDSGGQYLEYNALGGVIDLYLLDAPTPKEASKQYGELIGLPALMPYWSFGYHQCRYGMQDIWEVAGVVANYSEANIPLEVMWTDIDYMHYRRTMSLDPKRFNIDNMQQMVHTLHDRQQKYIVMVDPAVAKVSYPPYDDGVEDDVFMKEKNGTWYTGVVWAGPSVFPDWFDAKTQQYWNQQFEDFFSPEDGVDIDGLWIDMNEASNFCDYPCPDPELYSIQNNNPPRPPPARMHSPYEIPGFPENFQPECVAYVTFNVNANVNSTEEQLLLLGDAFAIGDGHPKDAPPMWGYETEPPIFNITVQLPANSQVSYEYVRCEFSVDGAYTFEAENRTVQTSDCNSLDEPQQVNDELADGRSSARSRKLLRRYFPAGQPHAAQMLEARQIPLPDTPGSMLGLPDRHLIDPPYNISNHQGDGDLSGQTIPTNLYHSNGLTEYDAHNLYGTMMSSASRWAMINRRPGLRPLIITRSTFAGAGRHVGHWFGDNTATWLAYTISIQQMIEFAGLFQMPMVGSDVCGFNYNTTIPLCSRWAMLGAFNPFYRNHKEQGDLVQEFYRWPQVADAGRKAINMRYQLLDYLYTAMYRQNQTGDPTINALFFMYPNDTNTFGIQHQFFFGNSIMISPVLEENSTTVEPYIPDDIFYDYETFQPLRGEGARMTFNDVNFTTIPMHIRGGSIIPLRIQSANTTTELRKHNFRLLIAPGLDRKASGSLYLDDGESLVQNGVTDVEFEYSEEGSFEMDGTFGFDSGVSVQEIVVLGKDGSPSGSGEKGVYDEASGSMRWQVEMPLTEKASMQLA